MSEVRGVRFIADSMLGSLARWLRILGFDTLYFRDIRDNDLIRIARQQQRIIITRDTGLLRSRKVERIILVRSNDLKGQLKEFLNWVEVQGLNPCPFKICPICNGKVLPVEKSKVSNDVPEYVFLRIKTFYQCSNCGKVYWEGSHMKGMERLINQLSFNKLTMQRD